MVCSSRRPVERYGHAMATTDGAVSDEELTALALDADPDAPLAADAEPWRPDDERAALLPAWYMPAAVASGRRRHRIVVGLVIGALLAVNGAGLCVTYGLPEIAW
jgi:hypothetical protein